MLLAIIAGCEVGFWLFLLAGLGARYALRRRRLGAVLLLGVPLVDVVLFACTVIDLRAGTTADFTHGLAAAYLGSSVAFGHGMIRWADQRFAHRFADGPPPWRPPRHGTARTRHEWKEFGKATLAWAISCALLIGAIVLVGDADRTAALRAWLMRLTVVLAVWALVPIGHTIRPARPKETSPGP